MIWAEGLQARGSWGTREPCRVQPHEAVMETEDLVGGGSEDGEREGRCP